MGKVRDGYFFTEMVVGTVFTLVAASMWVELAKRLIADYFNGNIKMQILMAATLTFLSIIILKYLFATKTETYKKVQESR